MKQPKMRKTKYPLAEEVKDYLRNINESEFLVQDEEYDVPNEIDHIEQSVVVFVKNLLKHESREVKVLEKFYRKIQPFYDYWNKFTACKKGCGCCCYIHVDITHIDCLLIDKKLNEPRKYKNSDMFLYGNKAPAKNEHIKCPFLRDSICSIYEVRPFVCRKYLILSTNGVCNMVKNFGTPNNEISSLIRSPNIEYAYYLIKSKYNRKNNLNDYPIDIKKYYSKYCEI